jgi:hypothetical protein
MGRAGKRLGAEWMNVSRAMALTTCTLRDRMNCGLIVRARAMAASGGRFGNLYGDYRNISQVIIAISDRRLSTPKRAHVASRCYGCRAVSSAGLGMLDSTV